MNAVPEIPSGRKKGLSRAGRSYSLRGVGFIDTLAAKVFAASEEFLNALAFVVQLHEHSAYSRTSQPEVRKTYFSDNIGASVALERLGGEQQKRAMGELLRQLSVIQLYYLLEFGVLCRGGVAVGPCFHNENMIFGPALVSAVLLEQSAGSPRVAVSAEAAELAGADIVPLLPAEPLQNPRPPLNEPGGMAVAIDYMRAEVLDSPERDNHFVRIGTAIDAGISSAGSDEGVRAKWLWTQDYLRRMMSECQ